MGVPLPFHGEVSTARWEVTDLAGDAVTLTTPTRLPLVLERRMRLAPDGSTLLIEETVRLDADVAVPYLWGHHPAFVAADGARIDLPDGIRVTVDDGYAAANSDLPARRHGRLATRLGAERRHGRRGPGRCGSDRAAGVSVGLRRGRWLGRDPGRGPGPGRRDGVGCGHLPARLVLAGDRWSGPPVAWPVPDRGHRTPDRRAVGRPGGRGRRGGRPTDSSPVGRIRPGSPSACSMPTIGRSGPSPAMVT